MVTERERAKSYYLHIYLRYVYFVVVLKKCHNLFLAIVYVLDYSNMSFVGALRLITYTFLSFYVYLL